MLKGKEIHAIIRERKERERLVAQECRTGEQLPPLLELMRASEVIGKQGFSLEEIDAERARCRARRMARK
jgi:hypothetical protein